MARLQKLTPLTKGGKIERHNGKGSEQAPMPARADMSKLKTGLGGINDYAKATPMAKGFGPPGGGFGGM